MLFSVRQFPHLGLLLDSGRNPTRRTTVKVGMLQLQRWRTPTLRELFADAFARSHTRARPPVRLSAPTTLGLLRVGPSRSLASSFSPLFHSLCAGLSWSIPSTTVPTWTTLPVVQSRESSIHGIHPNDRKKCIFPFLGLGSETFRSPTQPTPPPFPFSPVQFMGDHSPCHPHLFTTTGGMQHVQSSKELTVILKGTRPRP